MLTMIMQTLVMVLLFVPHLTQASRVQKFDSCYEPMSAALSMDEEPSPPVSSHGGKSQPSHARPHGEEPSLTARPLSEELTPTRKTRTGVKLFSGDNCRPGKVAKRQKSIRRGTYSDRLFSQSMW
ncbi:hypothetical protein Tco_0842840 [Tanacetum coccineum]|uniref:Uncharacterized protein n=1 Tax=Tanacetum coccineum TaxID=301880 RepID=A0ABQ5B1L3_9ASTR